jgi:hypothetical protein
MEIAKGMTVGELKQLLADARDDAPIIIETCIKAEDGLRRVVGYLWKGKVMTKPSQYAGTPVIDVVLPGNGEVTAGPPWDVTMN